MELHAAPVEAATADTAQHEKLARVNLAAMYRLVEQSGWGEGIFNHISMRVPGSPREFLIKPHELGYAEVTASNLVRVSMDDDLDERSGVNRPGFVLHSTILKARSDVNCALHVHVPEVVAVGALRRGLRMYCQAALRFYEQLGYHPYEGLTESLEEGPRMMKALGRNGVALLLRNHGAVTVSETAWGAFSLMRYLVSACKIQLQIEGAGGEAVEISQGACESARKQLSSHNTGRAGADWPAWLRRLDAVDPTYRF
ncbi:class II aldolase/adducin family protein [Ramlibacter sp. WS9]|uniref:class II aldolase/adducin family protein n=1 Tax=Ramlibacter sp. WS9 TaxID=1882741 RepID=UPI001E443141|nr:class II aldolase/adducin family protein [Ramlibacter sp. WS9]HSV36716.1 class II aldolase/adducin family protein [Ramlibacter sp.]